MLNTETNQIQMQFSFDQVSKSDFFSDIKPHIVQKFWKYHQENPHIFDLYVRFSEDLFRSGRKYYGARAITERIRWHLSVETVGDDFKMNDHYSSCYSRLLMMKYPKLVGFFRTRRSAQ